MKQPVAGALMTGSDLFKQYKGDEKCNAKDTDYVVLIVGFGTRDDIPYWKLKNQWGATWGNNGYMYIERGYQGQQYGACDIEYYGFYPLFPAASDPGLNKCLTVARQSVAVVDTTMKTIVGV